MEHAAISVTYRGHQCRTISQGFFFTNNQIKGLDKQNFQRKSVNIFLLINFNVCLGAQKNHII